MSYANGTTHYNLPQTVGSDKRDWFDTNQAFADIDSAIYSADQTAQGVASDVSDLNTAMGLVQDRVTATEGDITTLQGGLATANENIATNSSAITALQTAVGNNKQDLEDMIETNNEASATSAHAYAVGDYFIYNDTLYICTVAIRIGDTIVPNVNCNTTDVMSRVKALEQGGGGGGAEIDDTTTALDKVWSSSKTSTEINAVDTKVGDLNSLTTSIKTSVVNAINSLVTAIGNKADKTNSVRYYGGNAQYWNGSSWVTIQMGGSMNVQRGSVTLTAPSGSSGAASITSEDITITTVDTTKTFVKACIQSYPNMSGGSSNAYPVVGAELVDATTLRVCVFGYGGLAPTVSWEVVEFE